MTLRVWTDLPEAFYVRKRAKESRSRVGPAASIMPIGVRRCEPAGCARTDGMPVRLRRLLHLVGRPMPSAQAIARAAFALLCTNRGPARQPCGFRRVEEGGSERGKLEGELAVPSARSELGPFFRTAFHRAETLGPLSSYQ